LHYPTRTANSQNLPALKKNSPTFHQATGLTCRVSNVPLVELPTMHIEVLCGDKTHVQLMPPEAAQTNLPDTWGAQSHLSPDVAGDAGTM